MSDVTVARENWPCKCPVCTLFPFSGWAVRYRNAPVYDKVTECKVGDETVYLVVEGQEITTTFILSLASHFASFDEASAAAGEYILSTLRLNADVEPIQFEIR